MEPAQKPKNKLECFQSTFNLGLQKLKENPNNDHRWKILCPINQTIIWIIYKTQPKKSWSTNGHWSHKDGTIEQQSI